MARLRMDTAAYLRATEFVPTLPEGAERSWHIWGADATVGHRELMPLLWSAAVLELSSNGHIRLFATDDGPAIDLLQPVNAPLHADGEIAPSSVAFDVRFGIVTKLKNSKRIGVQAAEAVGLASPELTVTEVARWGDIHARDELRGRFPLAPQRQLEKLGAATRREPERPSSLWGKLKAAVDNDNGRPTVDDFDLDDETLATLRGEAAPLAAELRAWLATPDGMAVHQSCAAAFDSTSPRHGQDPRL
ncbi:MAG: hypothetical protein AAF480_07715 [Actinomycetota bacterium]